MTSRMDDHDVAILRCVVEHLLPAEPNGLGGVETGALDALLEQANSSAIIRQLVATGLTMLDSRASRRSHGSFLECSMAEQVDILRELNEPGSADQVENGFIDLMRGLAAQRYASDQRIWAQIGYPGGTCLQGGLPDFAEPPKVLGS